MYRGFSHALLNPCFFVFDLGVEFPQAVTPYAYRCGNPQEGNNGDEGKENPEVMGHLLNHGSSGINTPYLHKRGEWIED